MTEIKTPAYILAHFPDVQLENGRIVCSETSDFTVVGNDGRRFLLLFSDVARAQKEIVDLRLTGLATFVEIHDPRELKTIASRMLRKHPGNPIGVNVDGEQMLSFGDLNELA
jgi:hypothetical protein